VDQLSTGLDGMIAAFVDDTRYRLDRTATAATFLLTGE
jgi:hypothetical protein